MTVELPDDLYDLANSLEATATELAEMARVLYDLYDEVDELKARVEDLEKELADAKEAEG